MKKINLFSVTLLALVMFACESSAPPKEAQQIDLTAEKGKAMGPSIKYMPEWKAFGWFTAADSVQWDIDINDNGNYAVYLEWSVSDEESGKEFLLTAGDRQLTGTVSKSGSWETYKKEKVGSITLDKGPQKIVFKSKTPFDKGALLDLRQLTLVAE